MRKAAREEENEAEDLDKFIREQDEQSEEQKASKGRGRGRGKGKGKGRGRAAAAKTRTQKTESKNQEPAEETEVSEPAGTPAKENGVSQEAEEKEDGPGKVPRKHSPKTKKKTNETNSKNADVSKKKHQRGVLSPSQSRLRIIKRKGAAKSERDLSTSSPVENLANRFDEAGDEPKPKTREARKRKDPSDKTPAESPGKNKKPSGKPPAESPGKIKKRKLESGDWGLVIFFSKKTFFHKGAYLY